MTVVLALLASMGAVALSERKFEHLLFGLTAFASIIAMFLIMVDDVAASIALALVLAASIAGTSSFKHDLSGFKLSASDLPLVFAGTAKFIFEQYRRAIVIYFLSALCVVLLAVAIITYAARIPMGIELRIAFLVISVTSCALLYRATDVAERTRATLSQRHSHFSAFIASLVSCAFRQGEGSTFTMSDMAEEPLPLLRAVAASGCVRPDIIVIQHESVFDPREFGLPVDACVQEFLSPSEGLSGALNVDIFGGGSWQSEFSLLTGLSSASFGRDAYHIFNRGAGRFNHSLPHALAALGYDTTLVAACRSNFLHYEKFYKSIGVKERVFTEDLAAPFDLEAFEATSADALFLPAAMNVFTTRLDASASPQFLYALTNFNHGPHDVARAGEQEAELARAYATASLPDAQYAEYYARLSQTAATWRALSADLARRYPDRPMVIVHYGDHQPVMVRRVEQHVARGRDEGRQFRTFYAVETLNMSRKPSGADGGADLDIAMLATAALQAAGLPLDEIFATRASLMAECGAVYFQSPSERKRRFHRTLVERGHIRLL